MISPRIGGGFVGDLGGFEGDGRIPGRSIRSGPFSPMRRLQLGSLPKARIKMG